MTARVTLTKTKLFFTAAELAEIFDVDIETVYRWARNNKIGYCPKLPGQRTYRFLPPHIEDFLNGIPPKTAAPKAPKPSRHPKYARSN